MRAKLDHASLAIGAIVAGGALRALAMPPVLGDVDSVNFARSLVTFEPQHQAPHFPGYPVFVAMTRAALLVTRDEVAALVLPSVVLWPLGAWLGFLGIRRHFGYGAALGLVVVSALAPGAVLVGGWPSSDGAGLAFLLGAAGLVGLALPGPEDAQTRRGLLVAAGLSLGLVLGVRLSFWPLIAALLSIGLLRTDRRAWPYLVLPFALGNFAWLVPLVSASGGPTSALRLALGFTSGHFTSFGGTALEAQSSIPLRLARAAYGLSNAGLGAWWPTHIPLTAGGLLEPVIGGVLVLVALTALLALPLGRTRRALSPMLALALPYLAWVLFAQNVEKPRHLTPLLPLVGLLLGAGLESGRGRSALAALALALGVVSADRVHVQRTDPTPEAALVLAVAAREPGTVAVFAGEEARLFEHLAPGHRVMRPANTEALQREAARLVALGVEVWVSSGATGASELATELEPVGEFVAREAVVGHDAVLRLYRYRPHSPGTTT